LLRYLRGDETISNQLKSLPQPEITFNYLGQFGHARTPEPAIVTASTAYGPLADPQERRHTLLDINGALSGGELQFGWTYSQNIHRRSTIETVANDFIESLQLLIQHCQSAEAGGYTPSDFSKARLSQKELDRFLIDLEEQIEGTPQ
jgi:non-ribosomal peptide synthase protein (TIGR01720 family)